MENKISNLINKIDSIKHTRPNGGEYWMARELMEVLGYIKWENFWDVIEKSKKSCLSISENVLDHFLDTRKVIEAGKGAKLERIDYYLDRYACYLIAQNGDPTKTEIAAAQTYFAIQTRRQEIADANEHQLLEQRLHLRKRVTKAVKELNKVAKQVGVQSYALFHNAGYQGLYSMGLTEIKKRKGISPKEQLYDRIGRVELAANQFRLTQTEEKLKRDGITNQADAVAMHKKVGAEVRATIHKIGGAMPENLPPEPSLKRLTSQKPKRLIKRESDLKTAE
jgi:DNA-damage-inducible protein D